ncbi:OmpA family protein [Maribacter sp. 2307ULW6-5]|uniref:OmpA family protein n=1 Tax=Maribacter sp. 2307ULW6-5 TaxID=3386275 RepID=UPI0039BC7526
MRKHISFALLCAVGTFLASAQERGLKKADGDFKEHSFYQAIESYESLLEKGYSKKEIYKNLGKSHYMNANYQEAANWYEKLFSTDPDLEDAESMFQYAQALKSLENYGSSDRWMEKLKALEAKDGRVAKWTENADYLDAIAKNSGRYTIKNEAFNSEFSDFAPSFKGDRLVFSSARDSGITKRNIHTWNNRPFLDLYETNEATGGALSTAKKLGKVLNKKTHESSSAFSKDGNTVFFTRNNSSRGNFERDQAGLSRLKIFRAERNGDTWGAPKELPFNSDEYSVAHPALGPDEKQLYFASDMPGTLGASDIFVVDLHDDGSYGTPKNLGGTVNTEARETFPFVTASNKLYFASDGHPGLGGLDIFATDLEEGSNGHIVNVGREINSEQDDFSFIINEDTKSGFFASNRAGGKGDDDIYGFVENVPLEFECSAMVAGTVRDIKTGSALANASVSLKNAEGETLATATTDENGMYRLEGDCEEGEYEIVATKEGYDLANGMFTKEAGSDLTDADLDLGNKVTGPEKGTDLAALLEIEPIYFDFDKWNIREDARESLAKVLAYMEQNPDVSIEIGSHTDSRGNDAYNQRLSERRAQSTMDYLVQNGIDANRLTAKGYGETQLKNDCGNGSVCSRDQHERNRRSEFIVR